MKISVVIPTHKPEKYIFECLDSLYSQSISHKDYDIIIVLNGCNEPWRSQIDDWIQQHPNLDIKFIQTDQPGVSNARNLALDQATGEYITFIDDDDYVSAEYLEELYKMATPNTVALSDAISFDDSTLEYNLNYGQHKVFINLHEKHDVSLFSARKMFNGPVMKLIHRDIIGNRKFEPKFKNGEDSLFMFLISDKIENVRFASPKAIYYRRFRRNSATTKKHGRMCIFRNRISMCWYYSKYYLSHPAKYDFSFLISRYAGSIKTIMCGR